MFTKQELLVKDLQALANLVAGAKNGLQVSSFEYQVLKLVRSNVMDLIDRVEEFKTVA